MVLSIFVLLKMVFSYFHMKKKKRKKKDNHIRFVSFFINTSSFFNFPH